MRTPRVGVVSAIALTVCLSVVSSSGTDWGGGVVVVGVVSSAFALVFGREQTTDPLKSVRGVASYAFVGTAIGAVTSVIVGSFLGVVGEGEGWGYLIPGLLLAVVAALAASVAGFVLRQGLPLDAVNQTVRRIERRLLVVLSLPYAETVVTVGKLIGGVIAVVTAIMGVVYWLFASLTAHWLFRPNRDQFFGRAIDSLPEFVVAYGELIVVPIFAPFVSVTFGIVVNLLMLLGLGLFFFSQYAIVEIGHRLYLIPREWLEE